ncbi:hypothetical protein, partial [Pseudoflavonifractor capillosus]
MPRKPCCARLPGSGARTFAPLCGAKVTAFLKAVEKVQGLFRQPEIATVFPLVFKSPFYVSIIMLF